MSDPDPDPHRRPEPPEQHEQHEQHAHRAQRAQQRRKDREQDEAQHEQQRAVRERSGSPARRTLDRLKERLWRARHQTGHERDIALLLAKSCAAGTVSWGLAQYVVASPQPTYAPFTALLVVQSTVYRTLLQSAQYVGAVILGVVVTGLVGPLVGDNVAAFAVMLVAGLLIGRWHRLGSQGVQVPVAAIFAFNAFHGTQLTMLWPIVSMVLLGAGVGVTVNLLLLPPMHYRTASEGVHELAVAVCSLLSDMAARLREGRPEDDTVADWSRRARELDDTVNKARYAVQHGAESVSYNPRRLVSSRTPSGFSGYHTLVEALARATEQIRSIVLGLRRALEGEQRRTPDDAFLRAYADFLDLVSRTARELGDPGTGAEALQERVENGREHFDALTERLRDETDWPALGALLTDAHRLLEEFERAHEEGAVRPGQEPGRRE